MSELTHISENLDKLIDELAFMAFGTSRSEALKNKVCVDCGGSVSQDSFKGKLSLREYAISGLCQACQDKVFGEE